MDLSKISEHKKWKYAKKEFERRFLFKKKPAFIQSLAYKNITDHYLTDSHLRLRKMWDDQSLVYKLTKKIRMNSKDASFHWISSIYLSEAEYEMLSALPAKLLQKRRFYLKVASQPTIAIDALEKAAHKIWLAEVEFESEEEMNAYHFPFPMAKEVTNQPEYSGRTFAT